MVKMRLALQRVDDQTSFEVEIEGQTPDDYLAELNAAREEGESEVQLISAWQVGEDEDEDETSEDEAKDETFSEEED